MRITNKIEKRYRKKLAAAIYRAINNEKRLTAKSPGEVKRFFDTGSIYVLFDEKNAAGFIVKEKIFENYFEVKSLYIYEKYRGKGFGGRLVKHVTSGKNENYLASTFYSEIITLTKGAGFEVTNYFHLPPRVTLKFILSKKVSSLIKHLFQKRSYLLLKHELN